MALEKKLNYKFAYTYVCVCVCFRQIKNTRKSNDRKLQVFGFPSQGSSEILEKMSLDSAVKLQGN